MAERKISYESLAHKSDGGFSIKAPSLQRLFIDSALAMTDTMVRLDTIKEVDRQPIKVSADSKDRLMVSWLNAVLALFESHKFLCKRIVFNHFDGKSIEAILHGETYAPLKHGHVSEIKAVTPLHLELCDLHDPQDPENLFFARIFLKL